METMKKTMSIAGTEYKNDHVFSNGRTVPIYEVTTLQGLNQIIGYVKFNNSHVDVFYRGECKLHPTLIPSLFRGYDQTGNQIKKLNNLLHLIETDDRLRNELKLANDEAGDQESILEGMLQHYGIPTRYIDLVDNHWVALWMGQHRNTKKKEIRTYYHYEKREMPYSEMMIGTSVDDGELYQYILMVGVDGRREKHNDGVEIASDSVVIDLRKALPSTFLRPHAQHGIVLKKKGADSNDSNFYDLSNNVIGILKIRIDRVSQWLGNGELLTQSNFFPSPMNDYGYDLLLSREDIFSKTIFEIAKYV